MQAILCDVSLEPIAGAAWELQLIHGRVAVPSPGAAASVVNRDSGTMLILSEDVGRWLLENLDQLRQAYQSLQEENRGTTSPLQAARQSPAVAERLAS